MGNVTHKRYPAPWDVATLTPNVRYHAIFIPKSQTTTISFETPIVLTVFFTRALQDRLQSISPLTVNAVNPGFCYSNLRNRFQGSLFNVIMLLTEKLLALTSEQGSRQIVYGAIGGRENEDGMKGAFVSKSEVVEPSDFVIGEEGRRMQDNLWVSGFARRFFLRD